MVLRAYKTRRILLFWSLFIGVSAIYGSLMMFIDPSGRLLGMDKMLGYFEVLPLSEYLYQDYVFPGIALLVINGITNLYASYLIIRNKKLGDILGMVFGMTLMAWITIQFIIFPFNVMSTAYFIFGFLQFITGYMTLVFRKQEEFKFNIDDYPYINPESTTLVVYFSRMGYTRKIAYEIANRKRCAIYEIKHSTEVVKAQYRHLIDEEKCRVTEWRFGPITGKYVIYRGESCEVNGIHYLNVEAYLKGLA